jgi:hypothetical protein
VAASNIPKKIFGSCTHAFHSVHIYKSQASMDTSNEHTLSPLSTDGDSQSHYTFSPLEHRKLSMLSGESNSEDDFEDEDCGISIKEDARSKHLWEEISGFKEKTDILQKKDYDLRWAYKQRDGANVFKCILHHNCDFLVRIRSEGTISLIYFGVPLIVKCRGFYRLLDSSRQFILCHRNFWGPCGELHDAEEDRHSQRLD